MDKLPSDIKHKKYFSSYKPNELFWGIGIENETYLEILTKEKLYGTFFKNQKPERYSVNYYKTYRNGEFNKALDTIIDKEKEYDLPILMNSHELTKNDLSGEPMTNYDKGSTPNKKFSGKTVFEYMKEQNEYFEKEYNMSYCFDGDTIEFMTLDFYKTTTHHVIDELKHSKKTFLQNLNNLHLPITKGAQFAYPKGNYGFARFTTNMKNLAIFNNGTYHFNFTLPTMLNANGEIEDRKSFDRRHAMAIRIIQVMEPFFIAKYGSGDILSLSEKYRKRYPRGSQRVAASRYIGGGSFDTNRIQTGKMLQGKRVLYARDWFNELYEQINYEKNDLIGFDINFNKFKNHGIELRFFDLFPIENLPEVLEFLVYLLDHSVVLEHLESCIDNEFWNSIMFRAVLEGKDAFLTKEEHMWLRKHLNITERLKSRRIIDVYNEIYTYLKNKYKYYGPCSRYMLEKPTVCC
jgi:hypothetical protein